MLFLSTLSLRRATSCCRCAAGLFRYFYPRSPCGERLILHVPGVDFQTFLSTLSLRRATNIGQYFDVIVDISIHALLAESDRILSIEDVTVDDFYPRSPCGERPATQAQQTADKAFLSTLSLRRATAAWQNLAAATTISIHALLAESDTHSPGAGGVARYFYPRSPCGERRCASKVRILQQRFLSTLSLRRATARCC